jgi:integrase
VLRLLRGEDLELLSRELGVVASTLSLWREEFLAAGQAVLKGKTGKADARDQQISRLKKKVGELHPHMLRHTYLSRLYNIEHDLRFVQDQAGHASPTTTAIYAKTNSMSRKRQVEALDGLEP